MPLSVCASHGETTPSQDISMPTSQHFWNSNLPSSQWTEECPEFLIGISEHNKQGLALKNKDFHVQAWSEAQELIRTNRIDLFRRLPSELRRYNKYIYDLKREYGAVHTFVQKERLHWGSLTSSGDVPFINTDDYRILYNDWPYGIESDIKHLVVWTKFLFQEDTFGDMTPETKDLIEAFVQRKFCGEKGVPRKQIAWFRNWKSLKSVHALEHFHIMLYKAPEEFLARITQGDTPMSDILPDQHR